MRRRIWVKPLLVLGAMIVGLVLAELGVRTWFAVTLRGDFLFYGTSRGPKSKQAQRWEAQIAIPAPNLQGEYGPYLKYAPGTRKTLHVDRQADITTTIRLNNHGFRGGPFNGDGLTGVCRIVCLGASSTFGIFNPDGQTYTHYLERVLNESVSVKNKNCECAGFEVFNFGVPHQNSAGIYSLFMNEVLKFEPDFVTFYEGSNDTRLIERPKLQRMLLRAARVSALCLVLQNVSETRLETFSAADVEYHTSGRSEFLLENLEKIRRECEARGIVFLVVTQQMRSFEIPDERVAEVSFEEEVRQVRGLLANGQRIRLPGLQFLLHADMMEAERAWATERGVPLVDFVRTLDDRSGLLTWVHLSSAANLALAREMGKPILGLACGED